MSRSRIGVEGVVPVAESELDDVPNQICATPWISEALRRHPLPRRVADLGVHDAAVRTAVQIAAALGPLLDANHSCPSKDNPGAATFASTFRSGVQVTVGRRSACRSYRRDPAFGGQVRQRVGTGTPVVGLPGSRSSEIAGPHPRMRRPLTAKWPDQRWDPRG